MTYIESSKTFDYTSRKTKSETIPRKMADLIARTKENLELLSAQGAQTSEALTRLDSLQLLTIPKEDGRSQNYYSLADSAGGVTEKTCLIDEVTLRATLEKLSTATSDADIQNNKIRMNAILKFPKEEQTVMNTFLNFPKTVKDTEVQREAIGLEIARILDFSSVTQSTLVSHDTGSGHHPCLFVPFGKMDMLTDSIDNYQSLNGRLKQAPEYKNIEDFGKYSAFFMLCSDPDFIGKKGQNKGLTTDDGQKKLYIFDQVFMSNENFSFDRGLNLVPTSPLSKLPKFVARHFMGRNKSVINDSSYEEKIGGILHLFSKKEAIQTMFKNVANANPDENSSMVSQLQSDAKKCLKSFNKRMLGLKKFIPALKVNGENCSIATLMGRSDKTEKAALLTKAMLLNQVLNKPKLFDKAGKPYKAPFFSHIRTGVRSVSFNQDDTVTINVSRRFGRPISAAKQAILESRGFTVSLDGKSARIDNAALLKLNENQLFKIQDPVVDKTHAYINHAEINNLAKTYRPNVKMVSEVLALVTHVEKCTDQNKLAEIKSALDKLNDLSANKKGSLGFIQHVKKNMIYAAVQHMMNTSPDKSDVIQSQFKTALSEGKQDEFINSRLLATSAPEIEHISTNEPVIEMMRELIKEQYPSDDADVIVKGIDKLVSLSQTATDEKKYQEGFAEYRLMIEEKTPILKPDTIKRMLAIPSFLQEALITAKSATLRTEVKPQDPRMDV